MYVDRDTVIKLLDKNNSKYDSNLIAINTLPKESIFNIVIEDTTTAEYYDEVKNELFIFPIDYDYITTTNSNYELQSNELNIEINKSLLEEDYYVNSSNIKTNLVIRIIVFILFIITSLLIVLSLKYYKT